MSALAPHMKAARIMAEAFEAEYYARADQAGKAKDETGRMLFAMMSVYHGAANRMADVIREEAQSKGMEP